MARGAEVEAAASMVAGEVVFMGAVGFMVADLVVAEEIMATAVHEAAFMAEDSEMRCLRMDSALEHDQRADQVQA